MKVGLIYFNNDKLVSRGVGYLASAITKAGHDLLFFDTVWVPESKDLSQIIAGSCDVVLLSATTLYWPRAQQMATSIRQICSVPIVLGGIHATIARDAILRECPAIDYICIGEGEDFIKEFLSKLHTQELYAIHGLGYRAADKIYLNPIRACTDLHSLGAFDFSLWNPKSVVRDAELVPGFTYVFATRGCPFKCTYCCNTYYLDLYKGNFLRTQNIEIVMDELRYLKTHYPVSMFYFGDEMLIFNEQYVTELFGRIAAELKMPYGCMARVEKITPSIVQLFKRTNCKYVGMGIECGDEQFRREWLHRYMTNEQIVDAFVVLRQIPNLWLTSYNMRGFPVPYDNRLTEATNAINRKIGPNHVQMTWYCPMIGTCLGDYCRAFGLVDEDKLAGINDYFAQSVLKSPIPEGLPTLGEWCQQGYSACH